MARLVAISFLLLAVLAVPARAADVTTQIHRDCEDDSQLQGTYTSAEIREALEELPSDLRIYSDCEDVLKRAELGDSKPEDQFGNTPDQPVAGGGFSEGQPTPTPTPPNTPANPDEQAALDLAPQVAEQPVTVGGEEVLAGVSPLRGGQAGNSLPGALVVALVVLGLAAVALAVPAARRARRR